MPINLSEDSISTWLGTLLRADVKEKDDSYIFEVDSNGVSANFELEKAKVLSIIESLSSKQEENETTLFDGKTYENLIRVESRFSFPMFHRFGSDTVHKEDLDNGISYIIGSPTDNYMVYLLSKVDNIASTDMLRTPMMLDRIRRQPDRFPQGSDALSAIKNLIPRLLTVRIESKKTKSYNEMARHANAFLFQLTYNLDESIVEARYLDDLLRSSRVLRGRRSRIEDIEAPKRLYIQDIVYHYQMGVATDSPSHEYLSFYHVAEHFFEEVYHDELIQNIRDRITQPSFSYKRKKDIQELIKEVSRKIKIRDESMTFSELDALKLTVEKFVHKDELVRNLRSYDPSLVDYYKNNKVSFSAGNIVDFENEIGFADSLSKRIYKTRNAIVHSKEGDKGKYIPFEHDKILVKEVPLLRFIADEIIINSSTLLG